MSKFETRSGVRAQTFPHEEQRFALSVNSADRSGLKQRQFRRALQTSLAAPGGFAVRLHPFVSLFAASLIVFAPFQAAAQDNDQDRNTSVRNRPRPEYDPVGVRLGGFDLNASLDLAATSTDNLFAEETGEDEDTFLTLSPYARLSSHWSRHSVSAEAGASFSSYNDFSSEDAETGFGALHGRFDIGSNTNVYGNARLAHEVEPRTDPDAPSTGTPVEYDRSELSAGIRHTFNRFRVSAEAGRYEDRYDNGQAFRDFDETRVTGRVEAEITPRLGLLFEATTDERDYDNTPGLSSDGQTYLVGATFNATDLLRGEIAVGQFSRDYDFGGGTDGTAVAANVEWYITRLTTITVNAHRNAEDVVGANTALPYVESQYGARVDHELRRNIILTAGAQAGTRDYDVIDRKDDFSYVEVGADYLLNRRVAIRGRYRHNEVQSDGADRYRDYEVNELTLGVSLRL